LQIFGFFENQLFFFKEFWWTRFHKKSRSFVHFLFEWSHIRASCSCKKNKGKGVGGLAEHVGSMQGHSKAGNSSHRDLRICVSFGNLSLESVFTMWFHGFSTIDFAKWRLRVFLFNVLLGFDLLWMIPEDRVTLYGKPANWFHWENPSKEQTHI